MVYKRVIMKTYAKCVTCFLRQAREAAHMAGAGADIQKKILEKVSAELTGLSLDVTPPEIARVIYGIVYEHLGTRDIYREVKHRSNMMAMELYPGLKDNVKKADDPFAVAVRLAVAGNVIDYGVPHSFDIKREIAECLAKDFSVFDLEDLRREISEAETVLYILDNAGEIVFDKLLISIIGKNVISAVRGRPIINDVTMEDASEICLDEVCRVISSASDLPGTVPEASSEEFQVYYENADVIISKGQGNFETLEGADKPIFFIFKAKCPVVADHLGCGVGDIILKKN